MPLRPTQDGPPASDSNPTNDKAPEGLHPYLSLGVDLSWSTSDTQAKTNSCPLCSRSDKFTVEIATSKFRCWKCSQTGNSRLFIRKIHQLGIPGTTASDYWEFCQKRKLLFPETLQSWGLVKSPINTEWLIPAHGVNKEINTLYRYIYSRKEERWYCCPLPVFKHHIFGAHLFNPKLEIVFVCEGVWDAMALWEVLGRTKEVDNKLVQTGNAETSLLSQANVLGLPTSYAPLNSYMDLFKNKIVNLMCQNDHERVHPVTKAVIPPASYVAMQRVAHGLLHSHNPPRQINYLHWGEGGFNPDLPSGWDIRDAFSNPF